MEIVGVKRYIWIEAEGIVGLHVSRTLVSQCDTPVMQLMHGAVGRGPCSDGEGAKACNVPPNSGTRRPL